MYTSAVVHIGYGVGLSGQGLFHVNGLILTPAAVIGVYKITLDS
jgi:hypothetical protein